MKGSGMSYTNLPLQAMTIIPIIRVLPERRDVSPFITTFPLLSPGGGLYYFHQLQ